MTEAPPVGTTVHVDYRKWGDRAHWQYPMRVLGHDGHGTWLWAPRGTPLRRGHDPQPDAPHGFVQVVTDGQWWSAIWNGGGRHEIYVDIATPASWDATTVSMIDLDLDVSRDRETGTVSVLDEDEFIEHQRRYRYPPDIVDRARTTTARIAVDVEQRREPFGEAGRRWLRDAQAGR